MSRRLRVVLSRLLCLAMVMLSISGAGTQTFMGVYGDDKETVVSDSVAVEESEETETKAKTPEDQELEKDRNALEITEKTSEDQEKEAQEEKPSKEESKSKSVKTKEKATRQEIERALDQGTELLTEKFDDKKFNHQQHWMAIALNGYGQKVPSTYLDKINNGDMPSANAGQYGKYILGILAAGGDPTHINGRNLLEELCHLKDMTQVEKYGSLYTTPYGLLALDATGYQIPKDAEFTREDIINKLLEYADPEAGEDGVGFVLTALGRYYPQNAKVKKAVNRVVKGWSEKQGSDGGFGAGAWSVENNVNSTAQVLMALSFNGIDPQGKDFSKEGHTPVTYILSLQNDDGSFNWQKEDKGSIAISTEQATYALAQYMRQLDGEKDIYDFGDQTPPDSQEELPQITTTLKEKTVKSDKITFTVTAKDAKNNAIIPAVQCNEKMLKGDEDTYCAPLKEGDNKIVVKAVDASKRAKKLEYTVVYKPETVPVSEDVQGQITFSIEQLSIQRGYILSRRTVDFQKGDTAWSILKKVLDQEGIPCKYQWTESYGSAYVQSINGLGEFDHGSGSGWMYQVNGTFPNYGASKYTLKDGDVLRWRYTTNLGEDLGQSMEQWTDGTIIEDRPIEWDAGDKTPAIDVPSNLTKDYTVKIPSTLHETRNITINIPAVKHDVWVDVEAVKSNIPKITIKRDGITAVIEKGTAIEKGNGKIGLWRLKNLDDSKLHKSIESILDEKTQLDEVTEGFCLGSNSETIELSKPITMTLDSSQGQIGVYMLKEQYKVLNVLEDVPVTEENAPYAMRENKAWTIKTRYLTAIYLGAVTQKTVAEIKPLSKPFTDEGQISAWAQDYVKKAVEKGLVQGNEGHFEPQTHVTRAEFTKMVVEAMGLGVETAPVAHYVDVPKESWFFPYIAAASKARIVQGDGETFNPYQKISREQMAVILVRATQKKLSDTGVTLKDMDQVSDWAKPSVKQAVSAKLMEGYNQSFAPKAYATREMAVVVVMRSMEHGGTEEAVLSPQETPECIADSYIDENGLWLQRSVTAPTVSSVAGDWTVLALARSELNVPKAYYSQYLKRVKETLGKNRGQLHAVKYTEYDRVILALSALGEDASQFEGYDLTKPLADFDTVVKQGLNGPVWALIALDSKDYEIPVDSTVTQQTTREKLINYILDNENTDGGWALNPSGPADADITAMVLQALSNYQDQAPVKAAIERGVQYLSAVQQTEGGFKSSWDAVSSCESTAQVVIALTALGIDPKTDSRFIKNGQSALDALRGFYIPGGGFKHVATGEKDAMATDQGMYALVAYQRFVKGQKKLYDMADATRLYSGGNAA